MFNAYLHHPLTVWPWRVSNLFGVNVLIYNMIVTASISGLLQRSKEISWISILYNHLWRCLSVLHTSTSSEKFHQTIWMGVPVAIGILESLASLSSVDERMVDFLSNLDQSGSSFHFWLLPLSGDSLEIAELSGQWQISRDQPITDAPFLCDPTHVSHVSFLPQILRNQVFFSQVFL